jgi:hypothetical protein
VCRSTIDQLQTSFAFGHASHVLGLDQREHVLQPLLAVGDGAGVEDQWFPAEDHHRVQVDEQGLAERLLHGMDHVRVLGDLGRRDLDPRADRRER